MEKIQKLSNGDYYAGRLPEITVTNGYDYLYDKSTGQYFNYPLSGRYHTIPVFHSINTNPSVYVPLGKTLMLRSADLFERDLAPFPVQNIGDVNYGYDYSGNFDWQTEKKQAYQHLDNKIKTRLATGYYDRYPYLYNRDLKLRDNYIRPCGGPTCINTITSVIDGKKSYSSNWLLYKDSKRGNSGYNLIFDNPKYKKPIPVNDPRIKPGAIFQYGANRGHSRMFLGWTYDENNNINGFRTREALGGYIFPWWFKLDHNDETLQTSEWPLDFTPTGIYIY